MQKMSVYVNTGRSAGNSLNNLQRIF